MRREQFKEGKLRGCLGSTCSNCCCDDDLVEEWILEYAAFHERLKDHWKNVGIEMEFIADRVKFKKCSDGEECKFIKYAPNKDIDFRPIDCKIYPYIVDWNTIDFDKKIVRLYYWDSDCPLVKKNSIPEEFRQEVRNIIRFYFAELFYGLRFKVIFANRVLKRHRFYHFKFDPNN